MTATTKQTAGNNATLALVRRIFNDPFYKKFASIYNAEGEEVALAYLQPHFTMEVRAGLVSFNKRHPRGWNGKHRPMLYPVPTP